MPTRYPWLVQMLIRLIINAAALVVAAKVIPDIHLDTNGGTTALVYIALVALVFGLVNTWIKPIATLVSLPLNLFALGLVGFIVNAAMLFLTAWVVGILQTPHILTLDRFPPTFSVEAVVAAVLGSIVISLVSSVLSLVAPD